MTATRDAVREEFLEMVRNQGPLPVAMFASTRPLQAHAPDCRGCAGTYICNRCDRVCGWCFGAVDDAPGICDDCFAAIGHVEDEP